MGRLSGQGRRASWLLEQRCSRRCGQPEYLSNVGQPPTLWLLVPFGENGIPVTCLSGIGVGCGNIGGFFYFVGPNCQGVPYIEAPTSLSQNSQRKPYSVVLSVSFSIFFPVGTPQSGDKLGIASRDFVGPYTGVVPCEPAWPSPREMFSPLSDGGFALIPDFNGNFTPPFRVQAP